MFDTSIFIILLVLAGLANVVAVPKIVKFSTQYSDFRAWKLLRFSAVTRALLVSISACLAGAYAAPRIGLNTPFISSLISFEASGLVLLQQLWPALLLCILIVAGAALVRSVFTYQYQTIFQYFSLPLRVRIFDGIAEEVVYRWGLMSALAYFIAIQFDVERNVAIVIAMVLAAFASSLMHVSDLISFNFNHVASKISALVLVNFGAALGYGWLFWRYGLTAAIFCHVFVVAVTACGERLKGAFDREEKGWNF